MKHGFYRVGCVSPDLRVGDVSYNTAKIIQAIWDGANAGASVLVLPELSVTGASCGDLFKQNALTLASESAIVKIAAASAGKQTLAIFGAPVRSGAYTYNCAVAVYSGKILGVVPKRSLSAEESRYFSIPDSAQEIKIGEGTYPFGNDIVFEAGTLGVGVLVGAEMEKPWLAAELCASGAKLIACVSARTKTVNSAQSLEDIAKASTEMLGCAYAVANACEDESTTDSLYAADNIICECGSVLAKAEPFADKNGLAVSEIDTELINKAQASVAVSSRNARKAVFELDEAKTEITRKINALPFVYGDGEKYESILQIQARALAKRLVASHSKCAVFGVSGGLDSTLALLVIVRAYDYLGWARDGICAVTMPCFGTTGRTKSNALSLSELCGATLREIDICASVRAHLADIGHDESVHNTTYENAQARERTQILMDISNQLGGLVVGTGDLSEIALGWSTYNADHMSMYNPNCDITKTLVRALVEYEADRLGADSAVGKVLFDILGTEVSPELLPAEDGKIVQKTEDILGPYEHHDFFLYNTVKYGFAPSKVYRLAKIAFNADTEEKKEALYLHLTTFIKRFFTQQFKRSCSPDGVKVCDVALSPRTEFKMPSDALYWTWLDELEANKNY